ncbi:hypothetical protein O4220_04610 [Rhodococcus ruber]|uniref:Uncharacterized protein n=1 Tax=Rhodococcus ruber TaxID=1830 RepID=A0ABT4MAP4_9NOCA|nr:hypothetical protein [Rhodococcus ruber]MCZ4517789.1 hypothetical protein [Rhodococcus ruber]
MSVRADMRDVASHDGSSRAQTARIDDSAGYRIECGNNPLPDT